MAVERVLVAIDVMNLWHSCQEVYGSSYRVAYPDLIKLVQSLAYTDLPREITFIAYVVELPPKDQRAKARERFIAYLRSFGFKIKKRKKQYDKNSGKAFGTDWDVGITLDAITRIKTYDTFTLVSGDGDFALLLDKLKWLGKRTEVITFEKSTSALLHQSANNVVYLVDAHVFQESNRHGSSKKDSSS